MTPREIIQEFMESVWIRGCAEDAHSFFTADAVIPGLMPGETLGLADLGTFITVARNVIHDHRIEVVRVISDGTWNAALISHYLKIDRATPPVRLEAQIMFRLRGNLIAEVINTINYVPLFTQAGLLSEDAIEQMLLSPAA